MINGDDVINAYKALCGELSHGLSIARAEVAAKDRLLLDKDKKIADLIVELAAVKAAKPAEDQPAA